MTPASLIGEIQQESNTAWKAKDNGLRMPLIGHPALFVASAVRLAVASRRVNGMNDDARGSLPLIYISVSRSHSKCQARWPNAALRARIELTGHDRRMALGWPCIDDESLGRESGELSYDACMAGGPLPARPSSCHSKLRVQAQLILAMLAECIISDVVLGSAWLGTAAFRRG